MYNKYSGGNNYNDYSNELFTEEIYAGRNRSYFIIVKKDKNEQVYLTLKELKFNSDDTKEVHRTMIFEADLGNFLVGLQNAVDFIKKDYPDAIITRERPAKEFSDVHEERPRGNRNYDNSSYNKNLNIVTTDNSAPKHKFMKRGFTSLPRPSNEILEQGLNQSIDNHNTNSKPDFQLESEIQETTSIISTKNYVAPAPTIITPKKIIEEPTIVDDKVTKEVRTKAPEKPVVTFDDMDDVLELN